MGLRRRLSEPLQRLLVADRAVPAGVGHVYEEYKALLIRRITKESETAGGVSLIGLLKDIAAWPAIAAEMLPELPPHAEVLADLQRLEAAVKPVNDVADRIYAHVDPRPPGALWEAFAGRDEALDVMLDVGVKYTTILDGPLPDEVYRGPTEFDIRELFGAPWIAEADVVPRFGSHE